MWRIFLRFLSHFDAEKIHNLSVFLMRFMARFCPRVLRVACADHVAKKRLRERPHPIRVAGLDFWGPLGLAAGFDKNATLLEAVHHMGFYFSEVGTVTPRAQPGNDKPRLFRILADEALFNRMGFNNAGCDAMRAQLKKFVSRKPWYFRVGINLGKNKDTPAEMAASDYVLGAENLAEFADYLVVNVSSPNTPGLRDLQNVKSLEEIVRATAGAIRRSGFERPLFLKLAPELEGDYVQQLATELPRWGGSGLILTNTLAGEFRGFKGGLSGRPLRERSREVLKIVRKKSDLPIISVGGIDSGEEAKLRLDAGANLLQIYSSWIYGGPQFPAKLANYLHHSS
jgi:dihydroorotate dehydrogenase